MKKLFLSISFLSIFLFPFFSGIKAQATFGEGSEVYATLLNDLKSDLYKGEWVKKVTLDGKERLMFVPWIRDHIHTMKAYKYWEKDMASYLDFFMGRQTEKGMYFDYWDSYKDKNVGQLFFTNCFDNEFYFVDVNNQVFFFRMPIEADLEYLLIEGVYTNWQTTGDQAFLKQWLPTLVKGMKYEMTDPLRWSSKNLLVKRPYSIDTWDFTSQPDSLKSVDRLLYHIGNTLETPKGIMHGDNSGMFQASKQLSRLFEAVGQTETAKEWSLQGDLFLLRLNTVCWNGKYYSHFIPEEPVPAQIKTDPINSIGLSNTYSMNRGVTTPEMAASIIKTYQEIGEKTKNESVAPWFGIYPFIAPHFGNYAVGEYMNGAVLPLVGGELTKAAFQNGYEKYAVEQLKVLQQIMNKNDGKLPGCVNADGTAQKEAIPSEWGQAAFVSALVEGLAGVVDKSILFQEVEISPRWYFAGVNQTSVNVGYGSDGNQVRYDYTFSPKSNQVRITTEGKFNRFSLRVPIPEKLKSAIATINGRKVPVVIDLVNQSRYAEVKGNGSVNSIDMKFK
ncbi:MAG: hypothetical protein Q8S54_14025 [Bacteroidota bacterium]|nr:hypothetical protein [Odoribacter sp.]MDP3644294.1 hypothetical protein [Bacteroidota bacterium]